MNYDTAVDSGSWLGVRQAATQLNEQCAGEKGIRYKGGWITAGDQDQILIRLSWIGSEIGGDETVVDGVEVG